MSTRNETWLIYGYSLPYDSKLVERIYDMPNEDEINLPWCGENAENKIGLLIDGMCGNYILCGKRAQQHCLGVNLNIIDQIENRLYPEYDGENVRMTDTGWITPEGEVNYL